MRCAYDASSSRGPDEGDARQLTLDFGLPAPAVPEAMPCPGSARPQAGRSPVALEPAPDGFPLNDAMRRLVADIASRVPALGHVRAEKIAFTVTQARSRSRYGTFAFIMPLRFESGARCVARGAKVYELPAVICDGEEMSYLVYLLAPRFFNMEAERKLRTIVHELYHIDPGFNGDLRRFPGRAWAHGHSKQEYDATVESLMRHYIGTSARNWPEPARFLKLSASDLDKRYGGIRYPRIPRPRAQLV